MPRYKAFINVVKQLVENGYFGDRNVIKIPNIEAESKQDALDKIKSDYPNFFQNEKIYTRATKDEAQFFYVLVYELSNYEVKEIEQGEWECAYCKTKHSNRYEHRPVVTRKPPFENLEFCPGGYDTCFKLYKEDYYKDAELPDNLIYVKQDSPISIYRITNKNTSQCYIGKTLNAPFFRWWDHLKHSSTPFGKMLSSSCLSDWTFEVLHELPNTTPNKEVLRIESEYIVKYDSIKNGYNTVISNKEALPDEVDKNQLELFN